MDFEGKDIISMNDLTREEIDEILLKVTRCLQSPRQEKSL